MTPQQARDYNILLKLKERVESKYKNRINIINKKPRIIFMSNIEENKISDEAKQRAKNHMSLKGAFEQAKEMDKQQKKDMLMDIDTDLALIEDSAKGELGNNITDLRVKIAKLLKL